MSRPVLHTARSREKGHAQPLQGTTQSCTHLVQYYVNVISCQTISLVVASGWQIFDNQSISRYNMSSYKTGTISSTGTGRVGFVCAQRNRDLYNQLNMANFDMEGEQGFGIGRQLGQK